MNEYKNIGPNCSFFLGIIPADQLKDPLDMSESSQDVVIISEVPPAPPIEPSPPRKRGRPRKNPHEVKPEIKGEDCVEIRPKRQCRAPFGREPYKPKERKSRGGTRGGRGSGRGRGSFARGGAVLGARTFLGTEVGTTIIGNVMITGMGSEVDHQVLQIAKVCTSF